MSGMNSPSSARAGGDPGGSLELSKRLSHMVVLRIRAERRNGLAPQGAELNLWKGVMTALFL